MVMVNESGMNRYSSVSSTTMQSLDIYHFCGVRENHHVKAFVPCQTARWPAQHWSLRTLTFFMHVKRNQQQKNRHFYDVWYCIIKASKSSTLHPLWPLLSCVPPPPTSPPPIWPCSTYLFICCVSCESCWIHPVTSHWGRAVPWRQSTKTDIPAGARILIFPILPQAHWSHHSTDSCAKVLRNQLQRCAQQSGHARTSAYLRRVILHSYRGFNHILLMTTGPWSVVVLNAKYLQCSVLQHTDSAFFLFFKLKESCHAVILG